MADYAMELVERYDFVVQKTNRIRGGILCDTDKGLFALREYTGSSKRLAFQNTFLEEMERLGPVHVDWLLPDQEENLVNAAADGKNYVMRRWYTGKEPDIRKSKEVCKLSGALAMVHLMYQKLKPLPPGEYPGKSICVSEEYQKYIKEMKRTSHYIVKKTVKMPYERMLLREYGEFYYQAEHALKHIHQAEEELLDTEAEKYDGVRHGNYTYHSLLMYGENLAVFDCGMVRRGLSICDFYALLRKTMEKTEWDIRTGETLFAGYEGFLPISRAERKLLLAMLEFPYKYWKLLNHYNNSSKAWIPERSLEKLERICRQREKKERFITEFFGDSFSKTSVHTIGNGYQ